MKTLLILFFLMTNCLLQASNGNLVKLYNEANDLYKKQHFDKALAIYQKLEKAPNEKIQFRALFNLANTHFQMGSFKKAEKYYKKALDLRPKDYAGKFNLEIAQNLKQKEQQQQGNQNKKDQDQQDGEQKKQQQENQNTEDQDQKESQQKKQKQKKAEKKEKQKKQAKKAKQEMSQEEAKRLIEAMSAENKKPKPDQKKQNGILTSNNDW